MSSPHVPRRRRIIRHVIVLALASGAMAACSPRQVEVRTAPNQPAAVSLQVDNNLQQAVNVYITLAGTDTFLRQVGPRSAATIPVQGFAPGSTVSLHATTIDGTKTYSRKDVVLTGTYQFPLP